MTDPEKIVFLEGGDGIDVDKEYEKMVEQASLEECAVQLPKGYLSVSQLTQWLRCPRQYMFRRVKNLIRPPAVTMVEGKAVHRGLEIGHHEALKAEKVPLDVMLDAHNDAWKTMKIDIDWNSEENREEKEEDILVRGRKFLSQYNQNYLPTLKAVVDKTGPFIERRFWTTVGEMKVPVLGFIDLVADDKDPKSTIIGSTVVDHKVVSRARTADDVQQDLQLTVYARMASVPNVRFNMFLKNKNPTIKAISAIRTLRDWKWAEFVIQEAAKGISSGVFPPGAPGWHCTPKWCGYYAECHDGVCHD